MTSLRQQVVPVVLVAVLPWALPPASAEDEGDFEVWTKATVTIPVTDHWRFSVAERFAFGDEARRLGDHQTDYAFSYSGLADWLGIGLGYKQRFEKDGDGWLVENRPLLSVTVRGKVCNVRVASRSRFEYRLQEDDEDVWRYRNKVTLTPPVTLTSLKIQPYLAEEALFTFNGEGFNQQRLEGGCFLPLREGIRLELFYIWKLTEGDEDSWHDSNILGSYLYFTF